MRRERESVTALFMTWGIEAGDSYDMELVLKRTIWLYVLNTRIMRRVRIKSEFNAR